MSHLDAAQPLRPLTADQPLVLWRESGAWVVASGYADLFAVRLADGQPAGRREFLMRLVPGGLMFGLPLTRLEGGEMGVIAVGGLGAGLQAVATPPVDELDSWVAGLAGLAGETLARETMRGAARVAAPGGEHLRPGDILTGAGRQMLWAEVVAGAVVVEGEDAARLPGGPPVALPAAGRLTAREPTELRLRRTEDLAAAGLLAAALEDFHRHAVQRICLAIAARRLTLEDLSRQRADLSRAALADGLGVLAAVVRPQSALVQPMAISGDPLHAVFQRVAAQLGVTLRKPSEQARQSGAAAMLKASGLRIRTVLLRDDWWRRDNGALAGRREDSGAPVALLPVPGGYVEWNPADGLSRPVTAEIVAGLSLQARMIYAAFPAGRLTPRDLVRYALGGGRGDLTFILLCALGTALLALVGPAATGMLVDSVIPAAALDQLGVLVGGLVAVAACTASLEFTKALTLLRVEGRMDSRLQSAVFDRLLRLPAPFFRQYTAGDLADRVLGVQTIRQMLAGSTMGSLLGGVFSLVSLGMLFAYSTSLALLALGLAVLSVVATVALTLVQLRHERVFARLRGRVEGMVLQLITGVAKLRVAAATDRALGHWARRHGEQKRHLHAAQMAAAWQAGFQAAFGPLATVAIFVGVALLAKQTLLDGELKGAAAAAAGKTGVMGAGAFLAFNAAFGQFVAGTTQMVHALTSVLGVVPIWERARPIMEAQPEDAVDRQPPGRIQGHIEFNTVDFAYHADAPKVLHELSFAIGAGAFVAVVGPSGGGKSTVLRLLMGLEQPSQGDILFDGKPLSRLNLQELRSQIGVVLQNGRILPGSVLTNILGAEAGRLDDAWEAARLVGLDQDIHAMPMGMHTVLMEGGGTLSGGQRQRLMIARALVRQPRILLLDEATSALDNRTQAIVTETLAALKITRVVIAHRLSTIEGVDHVLVVDKGRLAQRGTYAELMGQPGLFADLARRQLL